MPARDPRAQEKADQRTILVDIMEQAVQFYRLQLRTNIAAKARDYLGKARLAGNHAGTVSNRICGQQPQWVVSTSD